MVYMKKYVLTKLVRSINICSRVTYKHIFTDFKSQYLSYYIPLVQYWYTYSYNLAPNGHNCIRNSILFIKEQM